MDRKTASVIIIENHRNIILFQDKIIKKWTFPGGKGEDGEDWADIARRELYEESRCMFNIDVNNLPYIERGNHRAYIFHVDFVDVNIFSMNNVNNFSEDYQELISIIKINISDLHKFNLKYSTIIEDLKIVINRFKEIPFNKLALFIDHGLFTYKKYGQ